VRTTLSIDDDLARVLKNEMRKSGLSLKAAVNHFLRLGMQASKQTQRKPFTVRPRKLGLPAGISYDNVEELIEGIEGPSHK
jgi:hypothetical protein